MPKLLSFHDFTDEAKQRMLRRREPEPAVRLVSGLMRCLVLADHYKMELPTITNASDVPNPQVRGKDKDPKRRKQEKLNRRQNRRR